MAEGLNRVLLLGNLGADPELKVTQGGHDPSIACHTGRHACFYKQYQTTNEGGAWVDAEPVLQDPETIYAKKK